MIVRRVMKTNKILPGGGAVEMELSKLLRKHAMKTVGKEQIIYNAFAKSLEIIPRTIAQNAGLDSNKVMNKLRQKHALEQDGMYYGVDIHDEQDGTCNV